MFTKEELNLILTGLLSARSSHLDEAFMFWKSRHFPSCKNTALSELAQANKYVSAINKVCDLMGFGKEPVDRVKEEVLND